MFRLALLSACLALVLSQKKFCCTPDQWEGVLAELAGSVVTGTKHLVTGNITISYDYTNRRMATSSFLIVDDTQQRAKVILNYKTKMMYTITGNYNCTKTRLTGDMTKFCVPDNATFAGKITYGFDKQSLNAQAYFISVDKDTSIYVTTTTTNSCVPIGEVLYGSPNKVPTVQTLGYYDITPGIKSPWVFDPPPGCILYKNPTPAPAVSDLMNLFHAKVTKN